MSSLSLAAIDNAAYIAADRIRESYGILKSESNLSPQNARVTETLTRLVRTLASDACQCVATEKFLLQSDFLKAARENLPLLCGKAECEMEKFWARRFLSEPRCDLKDFWYYPEYAALVEAEAGLVSARHFDRVSFLGSGALPLTAYLLAQRLEHAKIICVDFDSEACDLSARLARRLGLQDRVEVRCMDALQYIPGRNELVICASLLQGRPEVYRNVRAGDGGLMVRDAEGVYQFLYKPAELPQEGFLEVAKTGTDVRRINTTRFYEMKRA